MCNNVTREDTLLFSSCTSVNAEGPARKSPDQGGKIAVAQAAARIQLKESLKLTYRLPHNTQQAPTTTTMNRPHTLSNTIGSALLSLPFLFVCSAYFPPAQDRRRRIESTFQPSSTHAQKKTRERESKARTLRSLDSFKDFSTPIHGS